MSKLDKINKFLDIVIVICFIINFYILIIGAIFTRDVNIPILISSPKKYNEAFYILNNDFDKNERVKTKEEYRKIVEEDIKLKFYIYTEKEMTNFSGKAYIVIRTIVMDKNTEGYDYCNVFAHEVIHIKQCIANESYVCFETFKYLYESEELHNIGVWYGIKQLTGAYGGEYNVADLIVDYLTNK